jgi:DNA excision repair protein ERCC-6
MLYTLGVEFVLRKLQKFPGTRGLTVLVTYDGLRKHKDSLNVIEWTAVCLDEGQKIRNPAAEISVICKMLPSYHR